MQTTPSTTEILDIDTSTYLGLGREPLRVPRRLAIELSDRAYLPRLDDLASDWVAHVATPAFKVLRNRKRQPIRSFCSIGTGSGLDVLAAIETLGPARVGLTDLHEDVVETANRNVRRNSLATPAVVIESGFGDLLAPLRPYKSRYDVIYENLPNVPLAESQHIDVARTSSNCVAPRKESVPELVKRQMLDLHYLALKQAEDYLENGGQVLSTIGARVPLETLVTLGVLGGFQSSFLTYTWKVQADPQDILVQHARQQDQGNGPFYFYRASTLRDVFGTVPIESSGETAFEIERSLLSERLDAGRAYAAWKQGDIIGHTVAVLMSERK